MKKFNVFFVTVCMIICVIPFLCMTFARTDTTTENKRLSELPDLYNGELNLDYLKDLGDYFNDRFAFRNAMVNADSLVQSNVFKTSSISTVIKGENGWLYYTDTLDDYLGKNTLTERGVYNIAHNLSIVQNYVKGKGADFAFTIAPNKNSLYNENMPYYYSKKASSNKNITSLTPLLKSANIEYTDLFSAFSEKDETLYLKRDSHWNNKGAMLAYNSLMESLNREHNDYMTTKALRSKSEYGDLNKMMYPLSAEPEWNYYYQYDYGYKYLTDTKSVEDAWIETENAAGSGILLMYRDSFGNTLLPFFAEEFKNSYFSKATPYLLEDNIESYSPDCVIIEKVERNIDEFALAPPVMTGTTAEPISPSKEETTGTILNVSNSELNASYVEIKGVIDDKYVDKTSDIYVSVSADGKETLYNAFNITDENSDNGYLLYLKKNTLSSDSIDIKIIVNSNNQAITVKKDSVNLDKLK